MYFFPLFIIFQPGLPAPPPALISDLVPLRGLRISLLWRNSLTFPLPRTGEKIFIFLSKANKHWQWLAESPRWLLPKNSRASLGTASGFPFLGNFGLEIGFKYWLSFSRPYSMTLVDPSQLSICCDSVMSSLTGNHPTSSPAPMSPQWPRPI